MWRKVGIGVGTVSSIGIVAAVAYGVHTYITVVRPMRALPRAQAEIEADWDTVSPWLRPPVAEPDDPELVKIVADIRETAPPSALTVSRLATWLADGNSVPDPGCDSTVLPSPPRQLDTLSWNAIGEALVAHDHTDEAGLLANQLRRRGVVGLAIATATDKSMGTPLAPSALYDALLVEIACADADVQAFVEGTVEGSQASWFIDFKIEQLKFRDYAARLLLAVEPTRDDLSAQRAAIEHVSVPKEHAPLASIMAGGIAWGVDATLLEMQEPAAAPRQTDR